MMASLWLYPFLVAVSLPPEGPINKKQLGRVIRQLRSCTSSAAPTPGGASITGGRQYAEAMRMELRGLDAKRWSPGSSERVFHLEKKAAFGQRFRFQLTVGADQVEWVRVRVGTRGDQGAYGAVWRENRIVFFPMEERCVESKCSWSRTREIEMTCSARAPK
ncbi:MAG: hypothetical protein AAF654_06065 [Myxococcota bacterium]